MSDTIINLNEEAIHTELKEFGSYQRRGSPYRDVFSRCVCTACGRHF